MGERTRNQDNNLWYEDGEPLTPQFLEAEAAEKAAALVEAAALEGEDAQKPFDFSALTITDPEAPKVVLKDSDIGKTVK